MLDVDMHTMDYINLSLPNPMMEGESTSQIQSRASTSKQYRLSSSSRNLDPNSTVLALNFDTSLERTVWNRLKLSAPGSVTSENDHQ